MRKKLFRNLRRPSVIYGVTVIHMVAAVFTLGMPGHAVMLAVAFLIGACMANDPRY